MLRILFVLLFYVSSSLVASQSPTGGYWDKYYQNTVNITKPHNTTSLAQLYFDVAGKKPGLAADLGTGTGRDALFLLDNGWNVFAMDAEPLSIEILMTRIKDDQKNQLEVLISPFENMVLPENMDLVNASFSLPFCDPDHFSECWQKITDHIAVGGRFAGQLFGDRDEWASDASMTFHTQEQVLNLFKDNFIIEYLQVEEGLLPTAAGQMKHWHVFHIIAKKIK